MIDQVRYVNRSLDLFSQDLLDPRMVVAQRVHGNTGQEIQIAFVRFVDQVGAASAVRQEFVPAVGSKQIFLFQLLYLRELHKAESLA